MKSHTRDTTPLFVRIPPDQAEALDRLAFETRRPKQELVSDLLGRYVAAPATRRSPELGYHSFRAAETDVLTLEGVAELLAVAPAAVEELAQRGELPGRRIAGQWRFARTAVLGWLAAGVGADAGRGSAPAATSGDR